MKQTIKNKIRRLINYGNEMNDIELDSAEKILKDNALYCGKHSITMLSSFVGIFLSWLLIKNSSIQKIKILGIELSEIDTVLMILPLLAAFIFYRFVSMMILNQVITEVLDEIFKKKYPSLFKIKITELFHFPSLFTVEHVFKQIEYNRLIIVISFIWNLLLVVLTHIIPILLIIWMSIDIFIEWNFIKILILCFVALLLIKTIIVIVRGVNQVK